MDNKKVFCIGLSRTGTTSICEALHMLGYETIHFSPHLFIHPEIINDSLSFNPKIKLNPYSNWLRKQEIDYHNQSFDKDFLNKFNAFGDSPFPFYFKELDKKFPGSKFIYTYRDSKKWVRSMKWLYEKGSIIWSQGFLNDEIKFQVYNCSKYDEEALLKSYFDHHSKVISYFSDRSDDLLMIDIDNRKVDFDILCQFLNKPVPNIPFPQKNASRKVSFKKRVFYYLSRNIPYIDLIKQKLRPLFKSVFS